MSEKDPDPPGLLGAREIAEVLGVSERTVKRLVEEEQIPFYRVRRQLRFDAAQVLEALRTPTPA